MPTKLLKSVFIGLGKFVGEAVRASDRRFVVAFPVRVFHYDAILIKQGSLSPLLDLCAKTDRVYALTQSRHGKIMSKRVAACITDVEKLVVALERDHIHALDMTINPERVGGVAVSQMHQMRIEISTDYVILH